MIEDPKLARQVEEISHMLTQTGEHMTRIGEGLDWQAPYVCATKIMMEALLVDCATRDPGFLQRLSDLVAPSLEHKHPSVGDAARQMLADSQEMAAILQGVGGKEPEVGH
jgi:hypothetical protein